MRFLSWLERGNPKPKPKSIVLPKPQLKTIVLPSHFNSLVEDALSFGALYSQKHDQTRIQALWEKLAAAKNLSFKLYDDVAYKGDFAPQMMRDMDEMLISIMREDPENAELAFGCIGCADHVRKGGVPTEFLSWMERRHRNLLRAFRIGEKNLSMNPREVASLAIAALSECYYSPDAWLSLETALLWEDATLAKSVRQVKDELRKAFKGETV